LAENYAPLPVKRLTSSRSVNANSYFGAALRYQHVMADRQAQLVSALDDLARAATVPAKGTRGT
jgi:hypothetical protein